MVLYLQFEHTSKVSLYIRFGAKSRVKIDMEINIFKRSTLVLEN